MASTLHRRNNNKLNNKTYNTIMKKAEDKIQEIIIEIDIELVQLNNQLSDEAKGWIDKVELQKQKHYLRGQKQAYFAALDIIVEASADIRKLL